MPMELNISSQYGNLTSMQFLTVMDDLLLLSPSKNSLITKLEDLLKALLKNGLKLSLTKCQLFRTNLHYMGNEIFIKDKRVCIKPQRNKLEAIQKLQLPTTVKGCRSFAGRQTVCLGKEQQDSFEEIKCRLVKSPVIHMPNTTARFYLYSDTSKF